MEYKIIKLKDADLQEVSKFIMDAKQSTGEWDADTTLERVEMHVRRNFEDTDDLVLIAEENSEIKGLIVIHFEQPSIIELNPWFLNGHPVVANVESSDTLATDLVRRVLDFSKENGLSSASVSFYKDHQFSSKRAFYENNGLHLQQELVHFRKDLAKLSLSQGELPSDVKIIPLEQVAMDDLYTCWYDAFSSSLDRDFKTRKNDEQRPYFDERFERDDSYSSASFALRSNQRPIGFALVRNTHGPNNAHLWELGVHPDFQRRGLARFLISSVIHELVEQEQIETMSINCDIANTPAFNLYTSFGFKEDWRMISYHIDLKS